MDPRDLPAQAGHAGAVLTTDGRYASWALPGGGGGGGGAYAVSAGHSGLWTMPWQLGGSVETVTGTAIPNCSVTLTTSGRPVRICLVSAYALGLSMGLPGYVALKGDYNLPGDQFLLWVAWKTGSTWIDQVRLRQSQVGTDESVRLDVPPTTFATVWTPPAGTYTIVAHAFLALDNTPPVAASGIVAYCSLLAHEL